MVKITRYTRDVSKQQASTGITTEDDTRLFLVLSANLRQLAVNGQATITGQLVTGADPNIGVARQMIVELMVHGVLYRFRTDTSGTFSFTYTARTWGEIVLQPIIPAGEDLIMDITPDNLDKAIIEV